MLGPPLLPTAHRMFGADEGLSCHCYVSMASYPVLKLAEGLDFFLHSSPLINTQVLDLYPHDGERVVKAR